MQLVREQLGKVGITVDKDYWSIDRAYDRLVIVEVKGEFRTYISRKPVPAGVLLNDREYWIPFSSLQEELISNYNAWLNKVSAILGDEVFAEKTKEVIKKEQEREIDLIYARIEQLKCFYPNNIIVNFILYNCSFDENTIHPSIALEPSLSDIFSDIPGSFNIVDYSTLMYRGTLNNDNNTIRIYTIFVSNREDIGNNNNLTLGGFMKLIPDENYTVSSNSVTREGYPECPHEVNSVAVELDYYSDTILTFELFSSTTIVVKAQKNG